MKLHLVIDVKRHNERDSATGVADDLLHYAAVTEAITNGETYNLVSAEWEDDAPTIKSYSIQARNDGYAVIEATCVPVSVHPTFEEAETERDKRNGPCTCVTCTR